MILKKRNLASALDAVTVSGIDATWTDWTIANAVKDGYKVSGWVYKAVSLISKNASVVPFVVKGKDNEIIWDHPITKLLLKPHPYLSKTQFFEILIQWLQLAGNGYIHTVEDSRAVAELWLISPDRLSPIESKDNSEFVSGYQSKTKDGIARLSTEFTTENIIPMMLTNPANPIVGISPLQVVAKTVDCDVAQQTWNTSTMQNRGVVDGVFTFKTPLDKVQTDSIVDRIMRKFSGTANARKPLVIGSDASYQRLSLTSAEMDFLESRKFSRDEIFVIFGVPPQLGGSQESATYNNFSESMRIFWETTLIPLVGLISTQLHNSLDKYLSDGQYIHYDLTGISALRESETEKAETAKAYFDMGVPFEQLNTKFELGFEAYKGWDLPFNGLESGKESDSTDDKGKETEKRALELIPFERRNIDNEIAMREQLSTGAVKNAWAKLLERQQVAVYLALSNNEDPVPVVNSYRKETRQLIENVTVGVASQFAETVVVVGKRGKPLNFEHRSELEDAMVAKYLEKAGYILEELSNIEQSTVGVILDQVRDASEKGYQWAELRKALDDTGIFSPDRALRIATTEVGTASSIGQISSAELAGAELKTWENTGAETRPAHQARAGEEVKIDERFSAQISATGPMFPLDPVLSTADRVNCDCYMTFRVE